MSARLLLIALVLWPLSAGATFKPPDLVGHLVDTSNTVKGSDLSSIDSRLAAFRRKTGAVIVVYVIGSLQGESIEDAAYTTFNAWRIGAVGKDNGILLAIAPVERKVRIETGKGIGGAVTDLQSNDIIAKMVPAMQKFQLVAAIDLACTELEMLILHEVAPLLAAEKAKAKAKPARSLLWLYIVLGVVGVIGVLMIASRKVRGVLWPILKAFGFVFYGIAKLFEMFGGKRDKSDSYRGGGGSSGGGGSTGSY